MNCHIFAAKSLVVIFLLISANHLSAQFVPRKIKTIKGEVGVTETKNFDALMLTMEGFGMNTRSILTDQSVKSYMMPPRRVNRMEHGVAYSLASCLEFYVNYRENYKVNLSPDYVSLSLQAIGKRSSIEDALRFLVEYGTVNAAIVPYGATSISSSVYATPKYSIRNYLHIFRPDTRGKQKIYEVRKAILRGNPVIVEMQIDESFNDLQGIEFWEGNSNRTSTTQPLLIVSYDEDLEAVELLNTRGNTWGTNGYLWVKYSDFEQMAQNGYVLIPE